MQSPTCTGIRVRSVRDAHLIFHAVMCGILPIVSRRLDTEERRAVCAGNVYVWEERGRNAEATGLGIERWTDGIRWSASRVRDEFLLYHERGNSSDLDLSDTETAISGTSPGPTVSSSTHYRLVKQTYSVLVETPRGQRKWHMTAYFIPATVDKLYTVDDMPQVAHLQLPRGMYTSAKVGKGRARDLRPDDGDGSQIGLGPPGAASPYYPPYMPPQSPQVVMGGFPSPFPSSPPLHPSQAFYYAGQVDPAGRPLSVHCPSIVFPQSRAPYSPRHPVDDAALRSLKGVM